MLAYAESEASDAQRHMSQPVKRDRDARYLELIAAPGDGNLLSILTRRMLCERGEYESWGSVCKGLDIAQGEVLAWLVADAGRYAEFQRALRLQREIKADDAADGVDAMVGIADGVEEDALAIGKAKLRLVARKDRAIFRTDLAAVLSPERYGRVRATVDAPSVTPDAALLGFAGDLLRLVAERSGAAPASGVERDITGESRVVDGEVL